MGISVKGNSLLIAEKASSFGASLDKVARRSRNLVFFSVFSGLLLSMSPFIFSTIISSQVRIGLVSIVFFYLIVSVDRISSNQLLLILLVITWAFLYVLFSSSDLFEIRSHNVVTLSNIYIFGILLYRAIIFNPKFTNLLIKYYMYFSAGLALCAILAIFYYFILGEYFFNFDISKFSYDYIVTPFGMILVKEFPKFTSYRSCSYFVEPVMAAFIFAGNFFIIKRHEKSKYFSILNLLAGIVLFSFAYYIMVIYFYYAVKIKKNKFIYVVLGLFIIVTFVQLINLLQSSSMSVRIDSAYMFFDQIQHWSLLNWLFGFSDEALYGNSFSTGFMQMSWDYGLLGMILYFSIVYVISGKNYIITMGIFIISLMIDPSICPVYYVVIIVLGLLQSKKDKSELL